MTTDRTLFFFSNFEYTNHPARIAGTTLSPKSLYNPIPAIAGKRFFQCHKDFWSLFSLISKLNINKYECLGVC